MSVTYSKNGEAKAATAAGFPKRKARVSSINVRVVSSHAVEVMKAEDEIEADLGSLEDVLAADVSVSIFHCYQQC